MTQTTFYKNRSRPTLCKLWADKNGRGRSRHSACGLGYPLAQALGAGACASLRDRLRRPALRASLFGASRKLGGYDPSRQVSGDVMRKVEQNMLLAALVSWVITHVMDMLLVILSSIRNLTWEKTMKYLYAVIQSAETLVVNIVCSPAIVVGVLLGWLAHVTRAVGMFGNQQHLKSALHGAMPLRPATLPFLLPVRVGSERAKHAKL